MQNQIGMNTLILKDGRLLAFEQFGTLNGIPVIHQHGFGDSRLARHPDNKLTIEAGVRLITVDRPGYGESSPEPDKILFTNQALRKMFEDGMKEAFKQGAAGWVRDVFACINWGFTPEEIQTPVKIFHGSADELLFTEMGRRLAQRLPHADFQLYEGEGHYCIFNHWSEILRTFSRDQE